MIGRLLKRGRNGREKDKAPISEVIVEQVPIAPSHTTVKMRPPPRPFQWSKLTALPPLSALPIPISSQNPNPAEQEHPAEQEQQSSFLFSTLFECTRLYLQSLSISLPSFPNSVDIETPTPLKPNYVVWPGLVLTAPSPLTVGIGFLCVLCCAFFVWKIVCRNGMSESNDDPLITQLNHLRRDFVAIMRIIRGGAIFYHGVPPPFMSNFEDARKAIQSRLRAIAENRSSWIHMIPCWTKGIICALKLAGILFLSFKFV